jgi:ADP-ribose pyrophosphatase
MVSDKQSVGMPQVGVGAVVFRDDAVLLVKRGQPPYAGQWAIPGGKVRAGETLQQAAEREILEETGITIRAGEPVFTFDLIEKDADDNLRWHYVVVDLVANYLKGEIRAGDDAREAGWFGRGQLADITVNPLTRKMLETRFDFV